MTKLVWNDTGQRMFETGTDRGVFFDENGLGTAWTGLTRVTEKVTGSTTKASYQDGVKTQESSNEGDFAATIEALTYPLALEEYVGYAFETNGLGFGLQKRKRFSFAYRTLIGNDLLSTEFGYQIHLVYNALATPSSKTVQTIASAATPTPLSWEISTVPTRVSGRRPTAHITLDSRRVPQNLMALVEAYIYGGQGITPIMPSIEGLRTLFGAWVTLPFTAKLDVKGILSENRATVVNLATRPSFEETSGTVDVWKNLLPNPNLEATTGHVDVRTNLSRNPRFVGNAGWSLPGNTGTFIGDGLVSIADDAIANRLLPYESAVITAVPGEVFTFSREFTVPSGYPAITIRYGIVAYNGATSLGGSVMSPNYVLEPGQTVTITVTMPSVPDTANGVRGIPYLLSAPAAGRRLKVDRNFVEKVPIGRSYFDADQRPRVRRNLATRPFPSATGNAGWPTNNGATHPIVNDTTVVRRPGTISRRTERAATNLNTAIASMYGAGIDIWNNAGRTSCKEGDTVRGSFYATADVDYKTRVILAFYNGAGSEISRVDSGDSVTYPANQWNRSQVVEAIAPAGTVTFGILNANISKATGNAVGGEKAWAQDAMIEVFTAGHEINPENSFIDGLEYPLRGYSLVWDGVAGMSSSSLYDDDFVLVWAGSPNDSPSLLQGVAVNRFNTDLLERSVRVQSNHWSKNPGKSIRVIPNPDNTSALSYAQTSSFTTTVGQIYTVVGTIRLAETQVGPLTSQARPRGFWVIGASNPSVTYISEAPNAPGEYEVRATFVATATSHAVRFMDGSPYTEVWWDELMVVEGYYLDGYFDGAVGKKLNRNLVHNAAMGGSLTGLNGIRGVLADGGSHVRYTVNNTSDTFPDARRIESAWFRIEPDKPLRLDAQVQSSVQNRQMRLAVMYRTDSLVSVGSVEYGPTMVATTIWRNVFYATDRPPRGATQARYYVTYAQHYSNVAPGDVMLLRRMTTCGVPFDGSSNDGAIATAWEGSAFASPSYQYDPDFTIVWSGTANDSPTIVTAVGYAGAIQYNGRLAISSVAWRSKGVRSMRLISTSDSMQSSVDGARLHSFSEADVGKTITVLATLRLDKEQINPSPDARRIIAGPAGNFYAMSQQIANQPGSQSISFTFEVMASGFLRLSNGSFNADIWIDDLSIIEGAYDGVSFNGADNAFLYNKQRVNTSWDGTPHASTSRFSYYTELPLDAFEGDAWLINNELWVYSPEFNSLAWRSYGTIPALT